MNAPMSDDCAGVCCGRVMPGFVVHCSFVQNHMHFINHLTNRPPASRRKDGQR